MRQKSEHYVNNKEFLAHMILFKESTQKARDSGEEDPQIPDEIGRIFVNIATHLSYKSNFINYGFREDMVADGIENCIQYIQNFDPDKSRNPFAYFTQIIYYAFLRRIQKEKRQLYVKYKSLENSQIMDDLMVNQSGERQSISTTGFGKMYDNMREFVGTYEEAIENKKKTKKKSEKGTTGKRGRKSANTPLKFVGETK
jgi:DNA-directed RNA polymerase specialized sigma24 family protein